MHQIYVIWVTEIASASP